MKKQIICYGEILWDQLPTGTVPGGAPMNVALRLTDLGHEGIVVSAVGADPLGEKLVDFIKERGAATDYIQTLSNYPTGVVQVSLDDVGIASYDICHPVAWDKIPHREALDTLVQSADALLFGSLAYRDEVSKATLLRLFHQAPMRIFDLNIRKPHFNLEETMYFLQSADFIKLNHEELAEITFLDPHENSIEQQIEKLRNYTGEKIILISRGSEGASLYHEGRLIHHPGFQVQVQDTVGAGDSFLAAFLARYLMDTPVELALAYACAMGSMVASRQGSNPKITAEEIEELMDYKPTENM